MRPTTISEASCRTSHYEKFILKTYLAEVETNPHYLAWRWVRPELIWFSGNRGRCKQRM